MALTYNINPQDALLRALDRVIITCDNWGDIGTHRDAGGGSLIQVLTTVSFAGMAIYPDSNVSTFDLDSGIFTNDPAGRITLVYDAVGIPTPYIGDVPSPMVIGCGERMYWSDTFIPAGQPITTTAVFGPDMGDNPTGSARFESPSLRIIAYMRAGFTPPTTRIPMHRYVDGATVTDVDGAYVVRAWPVGGRKHARVNFKLLSTLPMANVNADVSLSGVITDGTASGLNLFEVPLTAATPMLSPNEVTLIVNDMDVMWLLAKVQVTDVARTAIAYITMMATD